MQPLQNRGHITRSSPVLPLCIQNNGITLRKTKSILRKITNTILINIVNES